MSKLRKTYTKEEKLEIVKLSLEDNESVQSISERYGIVPEVSRSSYYNWLHRKDVEKQAFETTDLPMVVQEFVSY